MLPSPSAEKTWYALREVLSVLGSQGIGVGIGGVESIEDIQAPRREYNRIRIGYCARDAYNHCLVFGVLCQYLDTPMYYPHNGDLFKVVPFLARMINYHDLLMSLDTVEEAQCVVECTWDGSPLPDDLLGRVQSRGSTLCEF